MTRVARTAVAGLAGLSLAFAACRGGDDVPTTGAEALSKRKFIASADRRCIKAGEESYALIDAGGDALPCRCEPAAIRAAGRDRASASASAS